MGSNAKHVPDEQARDDDKDRVVRDVDRDLGVPRKERDEHERDDDHPRHDRDDDRARLALGIRFVVPACAVRAVLARLERLLDEAEQLRGERPRGELLLLATEWRGVGCRGGRGAIEVRAERDERDRDRTRPCRANRAARPGASGSARARRRTVPRTHLLSGSALLSVDWSGGMHATTRLRSAAQRGTVIKSATLPHTLLTFLHALALPLLTRLKNGEPELEPSQRRPNPRLAPHSASSSSHPELARLSSCSPSASSSSSNDTESALLRRDDDEYTLGMGVFGNDWKMRVRFLRFWGVERAPSAWSVASGGRGTSLPLPVELEDGGSGARVDDEAVDSRVLLAAPPFLSIDPDTPPRLVSPSALASNPSRSRSSASSSLTPTPSSSPRSGFRSVTVSPVGD